MCTTCRGSLLTNRGLYASTHYRAKDQPAGSHGSAFIPRILGDKDNVRILVLYIQLSGSLDSTWSEGSGETPRQHASPAQPKPLPRLAGTMRFDRPRRWHNIGPPIAGLPLWRNSNDKCGSSPLLPSWVVAGHLYAYYRWLVCLSSTGYTSDCGFGLIRFESAWSVRKIRLS